MTKPNYMMITVASCTPEFQQEALGLVGDLSQELKAEAGAVSTRYGVVTTGEHTNQLILFQTYQSMSGFEAAFHHYGSSGTYAKLVGNMHLQVTVRSMLKIEDLSLSNESTEKPNFGVATHWGSSDLMLDKLQGELSHFEDAGAMVLRFCTTLAGPSAGRRLLIVGYPSMDAIEKTYDALRESAGYRKILSEVELDWRNLISVIG